MISSRIRSVVAVLAALSFLSSCNHKDLCFDHPPHALRSQTRFTVSYNCLWEVGDNGRPTWQDNWPSSFGISYESLVPGVPDGLCVNAYGKNGKNIVSHVGADDGLVEMAVGENQLLLYNDDTEYIIFDNMNASVSAKATTRGRSRSSYSGSPVYAPKDGVAEPTVTSPDPLFCKYIADYDQQLLQTPATLDVTLQPLVFTYLIRYEFQHGLEYVSLARGALAGMAESVYLFDGHTGPEQATILYDCSVEPWGVQAIVNSFGVPDYPSPVYKSDPSPSFALNLEVRLSNGKTMNFNFDVTEQIKSQPHGGVIEVNDIYISDEDGKQGGSGFDVTIDGWGDYDDIIVKL